MHSPPLEALLRRHPVLGNDGANVARRAFFASFFPPHLKRHADSGSLVKLPKHRHLRYFTSLHRLFEPGAMGSMELPVILL